MLFLIKIQESKYINDMYSNEYLFFNWLNDFRGFDMDQSGRIDPRELVIKTEQLKTLSIEIDGEKLNLDKKSKDFSGQYNVYLDEPEINCCSLYWLELELGQNLPVFDEKLLQMGDSMLLIYDYKKFLEILDENLEKLHYHYSRKKVSYYNPKTINGDLSLHQKNNYYEYQNEYRILIGPTNKEAVKIPLPSLQRISHVIPSSDIGKLKIEI